MTYDPKAPLGALNAADELQRQYRRELALGTGINLDLVDAGMIEPDGSPVKIDWVRAGFAHERNCPCKSCQDCREGTWHRWQACTREGALCTQRRVDAEDAKRSVHELGCQCDVCQRCRSGGSHDRRSCTHAGCSEPVQLKE